MHRPITFNYCVRCKEHIIASGSNDARTPRGMRQLVTQQAPTGVMLGSDWYMGSDNEYLRDKDDYTCYIHVTSWGDFPGLDMLWYSDS